MKNPAHEIQWLRAPSASHVILPPPPRPPSVSFLFFYFWNLWRPNICQNHWMCAQGPKCGKNNNNKRRRKKNRLSFIECHKMWWYLVLDNNGKLMEKHLVDACLSRCHPGKWHTPRRQEICVGRQKGGQMAPKVEWVNQLELTPGGKMVLMWVREP